MSLQSVDSLLFALLCCMLLCAVHGSLNASCVGQTSSSQVPDGLERALTLFLLKAMGGFLSEDSKRQGSLKHH